MKPRVSIVVPAYNEGSDIEDVLGRLARGGRACRARSWSWSTRPTTRPLPTSRSTPAKDPRIRLLVNDVEPGPAQAIRYGIERAEADVVVVTMADGCDDPQQIDQLVRLVERGVVVAAASRYSRGGQQVGGPFLKGLLSRMAGLSLWALARVGTRDATNSFKAYDVGLRPIRSGSTPSAGFEIGIELVAKARRARLPVAELPTIWLERHQGMSNFKLVGWMPHYLRWWRFAFGPRLPVEEIRAAADREETAMSTVLVTGSAGFIGGYVVKELLDRGHQRGRGGQLLEVRTGQALLRRPSPLPVHRRRRPGRRPDGR